MTVEWSNPSSPVLERCYGECQLALRCSLWRQNVARLATEHKDCRVLIGRAARFRLQFVLIGCSKYGDSDRIRVDAIKAEVLPVRVQFGLKRQ
jgi:hypothetical protein